MLSCLHLVSPQHSTGAASLLVLGSSRTDLFFPVCSMKAGYKGVVFMNHSGVSIEGCVMCGKVWMGTLYSFRHG